MTKTYRVTRDVGEHDPGNWSGRDVAAGEVFPEFIGCTYGSCGDGVVLANEYGAFFEFPEDAVERVR